jgi:hypothetical protein
MYKIGVMINNLGPNQLAFYFINYANELVNRGNDVMAFIDTPALPCIPPGFSVMSSHEAWSYPGILIATNLSCLGKLINFPATTRKYFYVWDLEWLRMPVKNYKMLSVAYRHPAVKLIARSEEHRKTIEQCWNVEVPYVINNCNLIDFVEKIHAPTN